METALSPYKCLSSRPPRALAEFLGKVPCASQSHRAPHQRFRTRVSACELVASKNRNAWGSESTHCRSGRSGNTSSANNFVGEPPSFWMVGQ
jgi:hypothetical protein